MAESLHDDSPASQTRAIPETPPKHWPSTIRDIIPTASPIRPPADDSNGSKDSFLIVGVGTPFEYRIPSFPVIVVTI